MLYFLYKRKIVCKRIIFNLLFGGNKLINRELIKKLNKEKGLSQKEWEQLLGTFNEEDRAYAASIARKISLNRFGNKIFFQGLSCLLPSLSQDSSKTILPVESY